MNDATRELLLKTRKGSTAQFGVKEWENVLMELGFRVTVAKTGRTVTQFIAASPTGHSLTIVKEPHYKRITFYQLPSFLKTCNFDVVAESSKLLGMDTPEVEKKLKDLYVRDLTNTGTCPVCEGNFKREQGGGLHHHGFERPGDGVLHGSCFGVMYQPFEISAEGAKDYLEQSLVPHLQGLEDYLVRVNGGKITKFFKKVSKGTYYLGHLEYTTIEVTAESDKYEFERMTRDAVANTERSIQWAKREVKHFEKKVAEWKLDVLPEFKYAGKFKKV